MAGPPRPPGPPGHLQCPQALQGPQDHHPNGADHRPGLCKAEARGSIPYSLFEISQGYTRALQSPNHTYARSIIVDGDVPTHVDIVDDARRIGGSRRCTGVAESECDRPGTRYAILDVFV
jgi:hypothetical protein